MCKTYSLLSAAEQMKNMSTMFEKEALNPELAMYYTEADGFKMIRHPLVYSIMHAPIMNKMVNTQLASKKRIIAELEENGNYASILTYYERPYRLEALMKYASKLSDEEYWKSLGWIWADTENFYQNAKVWVSALLSKRPGREAMMSKEDKAAYHALPEVVTIYRGQSTKYKLGWSWTTDRDKAEWFANRFERDGSVYERTANKSDIVACLVGRGESEVIVNPRNVQLIALEKV